MWSLPDITRMNSEAFQQNKKLERAAHTGILDRKRLKCEWEGHYEPCEGELRHYLWYDIFSDDPKGILTLCEHHDGYYGSPSEGYFICEDCERVMVENYTWEHYDTMVGECTMLCLPCAAARHLAEPDNWIQLTDERIDGIDFEEVRRAKHVIGAEMPVPKGIRFVNNVEFDSMDGHCINGGGVEELQETLRQLKEDGEDRAVLILDAAYQFAVSVAVYAETAEGRDARRSESTQEPVTERQARDWLTERTLDLLVCLEKKGKT